MLNYSVARDELRKIAAEVRRPASLRAAEHLTAPTKNWKGLEKELKSQTFHAAAVKELGQVDDAKLREYIKTYGAYASSKSSLGEVRSRTKPNIGYKIKLLPGGRLGCGCRDWQYVHSVKGSDCAHIKQFKEMEKRP